MKRTSHSMGRYYLFNIFVPIVFFVSCIIFTSELSIKMPPKPRLNVQNFPRPPLLELTPRHLLIKWQGRTIADTKSAFWVLETYHAPSSLQSLTIMSPSNNISLLPTQIRSIYTLDTN